jgi:hypothetical protein
MNIDELIEKCRLTTEEMKYLNEPLLEAQLRKAIRVLEELGCLRDIETLKRGDMPE